MAIWKQNDVGTEVDKNFLSRFKDKRQSVEMIRAAGQTLSRRCLTGSVQGRRNPRPAEYSTGGGPSAAASAGRKLGLTGAAAVGVGGVVVATGFVSPAIRSDCYGRGSARSGKQGSNGLRSRAPQKFFYILDHLVQFKDFLLDQSNFSLDHIWNKQTLGNKAWFYPVFEISNQHFN
jgi:hypothetical protein